MIINNELLSYSLGSTKLKIVCKQHTIFSIYPEIFVIITKFAFFQMKMKFIWGSTIEFTHSSFRKAPKGFNAVHMILSSGKLIVTMIDSIVIIAIENKSIIACPSICIDRRSF